MHEIVQRPIFTGICLVLGGQEFNFHEQSKAICWQLLLLDISTQTPKAVIHYAVSVHNTNIVQLGMYFKGLLMYKSRFTHVWRRDSSGTLMEYTGKHYPRFELHIHSKILALVFLVNTMHV